MDKTPRAVLIKRALQAPRQLPENKRQRQTMRHDVNQMQKPPCQAPLGQFLSIKTRSVLEVPVPALPVPPRFAGMLRGSRCRPSLCGTKPSRSGFIFFPLEFFTTAALPPSSGVLRS